MRVSSHTVGAVKDRLWAHSVLSEDLTSASAGSAMDTGSTLKSAKKTLSNSYQMSSPFFDQICLFMQLRIKCLMIVE